MMKRCWGLALVALLLALPAFAQDAKPTTGVQAGGVAKILYSFAGENDATRYAGRNAGTLSLIDLRFSGQAGEHVTWNMEVAGSWFPDPERPDAIAFADDHKNGRVGIRQASIRIAGIVPYTTIELGEFIPHLSNYMARPVEDLDLIQYPLMNNARLMETGWQAAGIDLSPWQQTGFNAEIRLPYMLEIDAGMWNGMMPNGEGQPDFNPSKAASIALTYRPVEHLSLSFGHWGESFENNGKPGSLMGHGVRRLDIWYGWASYVTDTLEVTADFAQGSIPEQLTIADGTRLDQRWEGFQFTAGYWFRPNFEALFRFENFDPNTLDTPKIPSSRYDESNWYTLGMNYRLNENAEVSLNYVFKQELADFIEKGKGARYDGVTGRVIESGRDPLMADWDQKYSAQHNNLLLVQFQIWQ